MSSILKYDGLRTSKPGHRYFKRVSLAVLINNTKLVLSYKSLGQYKYSIGSLQARAPFIAEI